MQLKVADFLVKPITTADLVRSVIRALQGPGREENTESHIYTFMPAAGGVGTTTLALQTAFQLHHSVTRGASTLRGRPEFPAGRLRRDISTSNRASTSRKSRTSRSASTGNCSM
ncbi:hypothetical protein ACVOMV_13505 [Mesorhizobium atlanticum]